MSRSATAIVVASALGLAGCYGPEGSDYGGAPYYAPDHGPPGVVDDYGGGCWNCSYGGGGNRRPPPPPPGGSRYGGQGGPPPPGAGLPPRPPPGMPVRPIGPPLNPVNQRNGQPLIPQAPPPIR
jgi:hypothetical protein